MSPRPDAPVDPPGTDGAPPDTVAAGHDLRSSGAAPVGHFDELLSGPHALRPQWESFVRHAGALGAPQLARAQARVARQIHENGVTYNVYAAADGPTRPWALDPLPLIIPAAEWAALARGLRQRARLLEVMAADVYGVQRVLSEGLVPPALVLAHPGFLRACHGVTPPGGVFLHQVAFDLARGSDGRWWVVATRAQAPSGAGYALENRLIVSRLFPDAFREMRVHMLAQFFRALQEALPGGSSGGGEMPRVVLLTPGPYNETYFEHAYLARYLGFTLAEGGDLTVREDRVYLKTLRGLERVHAILRRLDDDFCDPLELRADSTLGVAGLVQAWRAGNVVVANAFGSGVLEAPSLAGFLPATCERLLGEPLALPSLATWWCGEAAALEDALSNVARLVLRSALPDRAAEPVFMADLDDAERAQWVARVRASPERYLLQEPVPLSYAPAWRGERFASRPLMLRVFLVTDGRGDYHVMPGGLTRIAGADRHVVSGQRGGSSKDTWVLSESPIETFSLLRGRLGVDDITRSQRVVSSRSGENLFWLGRYAERSENSARLLRAVLSRLSDAEAGASTSPFVRSCRRHGLLPATEAEYAGAPHRLELDLIQAMFDWRSRQSLAFNVEQTVRVAGTVRDRLSSDNLRLVNQLFEAFAPPNPPAGSLAEVLELIDQTIVLLVAIGGLETEHMTRDDGWRLLSLGRHVERLLYVTTTVGEVAASDDPEQPALLEWLLDLSDSTITYRARYMRRPEWLAVAHLLLFDRRNPRSAVYQLGKLAKHVDLLPGADLGELVTQIRRAAASCRLPGGADEAAVVRPDALAALLRQIEELALRLSDELALRYFSHVYEATRATAVR